MVNLIKEKLTGTIKGCTCENDSKQRSFLKDVEDFASPMISLEALFSSFSIDTHEGRDIATFDIPGAYLQEEMPEDKHIILKLRDEYVDIMCDVNEEHRKNVVIKNMERVLYMKLVRVIYGCIQSALLWYDLYSNTLKGVGFEINPYDKCIASKMINGNQCTIVWYVDDNKISHIEVKVVNNIFQRDIWGTNNYVRGFTRFFWNEYDNNKREESID